MSRPEKLSAAVPPVAPRAFLALAAGFLLLYAGVLVAARQQKAARAQLESVLPLAPRSDAGPVVPKPAPTPTEP